MLIHPAFIPLDLFKPQAVFALLGNVQVHLVWKTKDVVMAATSLHSCWSMTHTRRFRRATLLAQEPS
jgi:hypothetical protein